jgi:3-oxoacyl-[acyl-carrier-protein] synthase III
LSVEETSQRGWLSSNAAHFREAGFGMQRVCAPTTTAYELARRAVSAIRHDLDDVGAILYHSALPINSVLPAEGAVRPRQVRDLADFPVSQLQLDFDLGGAFVIGVSQQACTGFFGALRLARALLLAEPDLHKVLCVTSDRVPDDVSRESTYNPLADGAIACVVSRRERGFRLLDVHQISNGALSRASSDELVGSYFTYTHRLISETLAKAQLRLSDIDWIVPQNLARAAWQVMCSLLRFDQARVLFPTLAEVGHLVSGCNFVNLQEGLQRQLFRPGERLLLPVAGYGLNWQCLLLEKCANG